MKLRCQTCGQILANSESPDRCAECPASPFVPSAAWGAVGYLWRGLGMVLSQAKLRQLSFWPLLITFCVLLATLYFGLFHFYQYISTQIESLVSATEIGTFLKVFSLAFSSVALVVLFVFLFIPVSSLICIPFLDPLSQSAENLILGRTTQAPPFNREIFIKMLQEMFKLLAFKLLLLLLCLPLLLIPLIGQMFFLFMLAALMAIDCLDIILARKNYVFSEKLAFFWANRLRFFFFTLPLLLMIWIPLLQIFLIPAGAVAGAIFYLEAPKSVKKTADV